MSSGGGELDLDAVPIPGGSRYNLARAREKEYLAGPRDGQKPAQILSGLLLKPFLAKRIRSAESNPLR